MGWLYKQHPVTDPVAYLTGQYNHDGEHRTYLVLGAARVANTVYIALKSTDKATGQSYVFAAVILISNTRKDGFGYKDMDESVGPGECACPDRIMRLRRHPQPGLRRRLARPRRRAQEHRGGTAHEAQAPHARHHRHPAERGSLPRRENLHCVPHALLPAQNADLRAARPARILVPPLPRKSCRGNRHAAGRHGRRSACLTIRGDYDDEQSGRF
jgi:hypothetical protein